MARAPERSPALDQVNAVAIVDPAPARIQHLLRADTWLHALYTEWGGPGFYVPLHLAKNDTPDDPVIRILVSAGVQYMRIRALVSAGGSKGATSTLVITSSHTAATTTLTWQDVGSGDSLEGAFEVATSANPDDPNGPLLVRSGADWTISSDDLTLTYDAGNGTVWGLLFLPVHEVR